MHLDDIIARRVVVTSRTRGTFMAEMPKLTLAGLLQAIHGDGLASTKMRLMRPCFNSDRAELRERAPKLDPLVDYGFPFRSAEDKLSALRLDPTLVEVYASEQGTGLLQGAGGQLADVVLMFARASGTSAEFLGAWDVRGHLTKAAFRKRFASYLMKVPSTLQVASQRSRPSST